MTDIDIRFMKSEPGSVEKRQFSEKECEQIRALIGCVVQEAQNCLGVSLETIYFDIRAETRIWYRDYPIKTYGSTLQTDLVYVEVPPGELNEDAFRETVFHELHHAVRWQIFGSSWVGWRNLEDAVLVEGLATHFGDGQVSRSDWAQYNAELIEKWLPVFQTDKKNPNYNHARWFFGTHDLPRWLGYKIGKYLVDEICKRNPHLAHRDLIRMREDELLKLAGL